MNRVQTVIQCKPWSSLLVTPQPPQLQTPKKGLKQFFCMCPLIIYLSLHGWFNVVWKSLHSKLDGPSMSSWTTPPPTTPPTPSHPTPNPCPTRRPHRTPTPTHKKRPFHESLLELYSKFCDPSFMGSWLTAWTTSWLRYTQRHKHTQTDAGNNNIRRAKSPTVKKVYWPNKLCCKLIYTMKYT